MPSMTFFDYGCGRGDDLRRLGALGIDGSGWDPNHRPEAEKRSADVVNLGFVVNVIERPTERVDTLRAAWSLATKVLIVAARLVGDGEEEGLRPFEDGFLTRLGTFQKYYQQSELRDWVEAVLETPTVAAAPGILYVFRDDAERESYLATRQRRQISAPRLRRSDVLYEQHRSLLEPLMAFVTSRGRLPIEEEFPTFAETSRTFGSIGRAFRVVRKVTGDEQWDRIRDDRAQDLLVYVALARFARRPAFSKLPPDVRQDVKAFFRNYTQACSLADLLLFSAGVREKREAAFRASPVGKLMPTALYLHDSALHRLPAVLRLYEGCARSYVGRVEGANVLKLHRDQPRITYLSYPDFDAQAHPALLTTLSVHLQAFSIHQRSFQTTINPPILHRKEDLVAEDYPLRERFQRLTKQEERHGLFEDPSTIGTSDGWRAALTARGVTIRGHRLFRQRPNP